MSFPIYSIRDHLAEGSMASFQQSELTKVLLAHEASNLSASMLEQQSDGKPETEELEEQITEELTEQLSERELSERSLQLEKKSLKSRPQSSRSLRQKSLKSRPKSLQNR